MPLPIAWESDPGTLEAEKQSGVLSSLLAGCFSKSHRLPADLHAAVLSACSSGRSIIYTDDPF